MPSRQLLAIWRHAYSCGRMGNELIPFIGVAIAVVVIPGPDMALVARNVFRYGRSAGIATSLGICTGILGWGIAAVLGIATLLAASSVAFTALKVIGAAYLIYLGISTLRSHDAFDVRGSSGTARLPAGQAYLQGLVSALVNPKLGVFFLTLLPQFIGPDEPAAALRLAVIFDLIGLAWLLAYSVLLGALLGRQQVAEDDDAGMAHRHQHLDLAIAGRHAQPFDIDVATGQRSGGSRPHIRDRLLAESRREGGAGDPLLPAADPHRLDHDFRRVAGRRLGDDPLSQLRGDDLHVHFLHDFARPGALALACGGHRS